MPKTFSLSRSATLIATLAFSTAVFLTACGEASHAPKQESQAGADSQAAQDKQVRLPVVKVQQYTLHASLDLPGQLLAYQDVPLHAKEAGYISAIYVDRGSIVHKGQLLAVVTAPEMDARVKEAQSKMSATAADLSQSESHLQSIESKKQQAKAKLDADQLTYQRLQEAAKTPGAIAQNEVDLAQKAVESDKAMLASVRAEVLAAKNVVSAQRNNVTAASNVVKSQQALQDYLQIHAPFDGVITERNVHEGSIVAGDASRGALPMLRIQQKSLLRLVVAVPESSVAGIKLGGLINFTVPAFLGKTFSGKIARLGYALDEATRTMPVELDVPNADGELEPGMFATVQWLVTRPYETDFVPSSAVATDLKDTFVIRIKDGIAQRVIVTRGQQMGNLIEVVGDLSPGDTVALKATDEIKSGTHVATELADAQSVEDAGKHTSAGGE